MRLAALGLAPGARVLDLGCGEGRHVHALAGLPGVHVVGLDAHGPSLGRAAQGLGQVPRGGGGALLIQGDAFRLPFRNGAFDAVVCSEVLEHLPDVPGALREIDRVLSPGGALAVSVPRAWPERICWRLAPGAGGYGDQPGGHVRIFTEAGLKAALRAAGFSLRGRHFAHALHTPYWWLKAAFWSRRDDHPLVRLYHRFLVWDLMQRPRLTRWLDALLNPLMGKSLVLYLAKPAAGAPTS